MRLDGWASESQYLAHLAPIWLALPDEVRGTLYALSDVRVPPELGDAHPSLDRGRERPSGPNPVLVASWGDLQGVAPAPVVLVEHGAGQAYTDVDNGCYSGGAGRDRAVLFVVPSERVAERNRARYPTIPNAVVGSPVLDRYAARRGVEQPGCARRAHNPKAVGSNPTTATTVPWTGIYRRPAAPAVDAAGGALVGATQPGARLADSDRRGAPIVAVSFHWHDADGPPERMSAFSHYERVLADVATAFPGALGHAHPRWFNQLVWPMQNAGLEPIADFDEVVDRADVYVCDNSSSMYEWAALDRPVVVLNAPWYRRDVDLWPRFWECADVGIQCDEPEHLIESIKLALLDAEPVQRNRRQVVRNVYAAVDGQASKRAAEAIVCRLAQIEEDAPVPDPTDPLSAIPMNEPLAAPTHPPVPRLRAAGASDAEVVEAQRLWAHMSEADRWQATEWINSLSDEELREQVGEGRLDGPAPDPNEPPEGTVAEVRAWIGSDRDRALLAYDRELTRENVRPGVTDYAADVLRTPPGGADG